MDNGFLSGEQMRKNLSLRKETMKSRRLSLNDQILNLILYELERILEGNPDRIIVLFPSLLDWNIPLFQRPQHIALNLAEEGVLYLFGTTNTYDKIGAIEEIAPRCFLLNMMEPEIEAEILSFLAKKQKRVVVHLYSGDMQRGYEFVKRCLDRGFDILYEYIDELSPSISGIPLQRKIIERHLSILANTSCYVVATADKLFRDVLEKREPVRCALIPNGVDYSHFSSQSKNGFPKMLNDFKKKEIPIIGYFGALADWFDYALIEKLALTKREWQIVLIGLDYDGSLKKSRLLNFPNVHFLGAIPYQELPSYARQFDVSVIPFLLNEVTISTSPIKLFEYMAVGKPIVATALPECEKFNQILIAQDHDDFINKVKYALTLGGDETLALLLKEEAKKHTWTEKARSIVHLLNTK
ncbi:glycosyltransferase [Bacillus sp. FJAT-27445]|uniref:glycosyltransferase n=1 Tax=Bacillus sp. FJAT-27445 TaxID=1679166 RepID=UPI000743E631|nr:glycosyltransferase [Bacillus sp. FJAT-27445]